MTNQLDQHWSKHYVGGLDFRMIPSRSLTKILDHVDGNLPKNCLDIGCGTRQLTRELNHRGYACAGTDVSHAAIELARANTIRNTELTYLRHDIEKDSVENISGHPYSLITCKLVYAFIKDKPAFLSKIKQLLAPHGAFVVITPVHATVDDATPISVNYTETSRLLSDNFHTVTTIKDDGLTTFICN